MYEHHEKAHKDIEKNGCHIVYEHGTASFPPLAYSIGIEKTTKFPDLIVTGMDKDTAHFLINEYLYRIKDGEKFEPGKFYEDFLEDAKITFKAIDKKFYKSRFSHALWYYEGDDFTMHHLIWPDHDGVYPWEKKATKEYRALMPPLYARK